MSIGPSLPPHLQHLRGGGGGGGSSDDDDEDIGPRLPKIPCRGPPPSKPGLHSERSHYIVEKRGFGTYHNRNF